MSHMPVPIIELKCCCNVHYKPAPALVHITSPQLHLSSPSFNLDGRKERLEAELEEAERSIATLSKQHVYVTDD